MSAQSTSMLKKFPHILDAPSDVPHWLDPFTVTASRGFLPLTTPKIHLPKVFEPLESLVSNLPVLKEDGTPGLLATYELGPAVTKLPDLTEEIDKQVTEDGRPDKVTISALFRDYSWVASAYLLELVQNLGQGRRWHRNLQEMVKQRNLRTSSGQTSLCYLTHWIEFTMLSFAPLPPRKRSGLLSLTPS